MAELILKDEVYAIVGAAMEVHSELGAGFLEAVYPEAMAIELGLRAIPFVSQPHLVIMYKGQRLQKEYVADFVCYSSVMLDLKAMDKLGPREDAQLINELKATGFKVGLLVNFGNPSKLEWKRMVN